MNFTFTQDQLDFQEAIASMLKSEVTADSIRARWSAEAGVDAAFLVASTRAWPQFDVSAEALVVSTCKRPTSFYWLRPAGRWHCPNLSLSQSWSRRRCWSTFSIKA